MCNQTDLQTNLRCSKKPLSLIVLIALICCVESYLFYTPDLYAQVLLDSSPSVVDTNDDNKSADELIEEATELFQTEKSIDARSKLLKALKIAPEDYRPHMLLSIYYLSEVGHFRLAYRYAAKAVELFEKQNGGNSFDLLKQPDKWSEHARLLILLSESQLNLDRYEDALATLNKFEEAYWDPGEPSSKAWILMKLKRVDEAISVARLGLLRSAKKTNTYNVLGILLSLKGEKESALSAFSQAIKAEAASGSFSQISTPLNNSGEVYREWFEEGLARACFTQILRLPDGCEHILPSLNLVLLLIDEGRLLQSEQTLKNFETCFKQNPIRSDTEHRALLALGYGKIALRKGDASEALIHLKRANEETQWFGKIGTTVEDVQFAVNITTAQALIAQAAELRDTETDGVISNIALFAEAKLDDIKAWWLMRLAREIGLKQLSDLDDLYIRHSDAMIEYPTFGDVLAEFPLVSLRARFKRMAETDPRPMAQAHYVLYLASGLIESGDYSQAIALLTQLDALWRPVDRLAKAQTKRLLLLARENSRGLLHFGDEQEESTDIELTNSLFELMPSMVRQSDFALPLRSLDINVPNVANDFGRNIGKSLLRRRFRVASDSARNNAKYIVRVTANATKNEASNTTKLNVSMQLVVADLQTIVTTITKTITLDGSSDYKDAAELVNQFIADVFKHKADPADEPLPSIPVLENIFDKTKPSAETTP